MVFVSMWWEEINLSVFKTVSVCSQDWLQPRHPSASASPIDSQTDAHLTLLPAPSSPLSVWFSGEILIGLFLLYQLPLDRGKEWLPGLRPSKDVE